MSSLPVNKLGLLLRVLRISAGLDQAEVARHLQTSQPTISRWENGAGEPLPEQASIWLEICRGELPEDAHSGLAKVVGAWCSEDGAGREHLVPQLDRALLGLVGGQSGVYCTAVPYFADVAAGIGEVQSERSTPRRHLGVPREIYDRDPDCYALRVTGDSMSPLFQDGDIVVVSPRALLVDGCIVAAYIEPDGDIVKVYREQPDGAVVLEPVNPEYPQLTLEPQGEREGRIWGRVVLQQREL